MTMNLQSHYRSDILKIKEAEVTMLRSSYKKSVLGPVCQVSEIIHYIQCIASV